MALVETVGNSAQSNLMLQMMQMQQQMQQQMQEQLCQQSQQAQQMMQMQMQQQAQQSQQIMQMLMLGIGLLILNPLLQVSLLRPTTVDLSYLSPQKHRRKALVICNSLVLLF